MQRTSSKEMAKNAEKEDMVKIENHCNKKIRFVYLLPKDNIDSDIILANDYIDLEGHL